MPGYNDWTPDEWRCWLHDHGGLPDLSYMHSITQFQLACMEDPGLLVEWQEAYDMTLKEERELDRVQELSPLDP